MLFNSYEFLFGFLPILFAGYWLAGRIGGRAPILWLSLASFGFYGWWNPPFLLLLIASGIFNYSIGHWIGTARSDQRRKWIFRFGVVGNLAALGFFKYLGPTLSFLQTAGVPDLPVFAVVLPLGISFWTFTQIGFLVDRRDGLAGDLKPLDYSLFVNFFPHLIAGPILHVREIGPQILDPAVPRLKAAMFAPGITLFAIGLFKKVMIADPLAGVVDTGYSHAATLDLFNGWITVISYSMQLYFDFSGYSDMAIGLAAMLGFRFPLNFNSPYKSRSVIEHWQRWHMSLTRYLNLLLFNPISLMVARRRLARGQKVSSKAMREPGAFLSMLVLPTFYTFFLAGIWHGAGLQYLVYGLVWAVFLSINHGWRVFGPQRPKHLAPTRRAVVASVLLTYLAALVAQTFFRASSCTNALEVLRGTLGLRGIILPDPFSSHFGAIAPSFVRFGPAIPDVYQLGVMLAAMVLVWATPNSQEMLGRFAPVLEEVGPCRPAWLRWQPNKRWMVVTALLLWIVILNLNKVTTFIYFQF